MTALFSEKRHITFVLAAPHPYYREDWWIKNQLNIEKKPSVTLNAANGYTLKKFELSEEEINVSFDPNIDPGLHFR